MKKNILITGANGFIGQRLVERLRQKGNFVIFEYHHNKDGDIAKEGSLNKYRDKNIHHVFHLAAIANVSKCWSETSEVMRVNIMGTQQILEFCRHTNAHITFASTYLYGNPTIFPISEVADLQPNNPYAVSKKIGEDLFKYYSEMFEVKSCILRLFNIYGIGQKSDFLIPLILEQLIKNQKTGDPIIVRTIKPKRDYVYLDDLVEAFYQSICFLDQEEVKENVFNIASGVSYSVKDIFEIARNIMRVDLGIISKNIERPNTIFDTKADISRAKEILGWKPKISLQQGIEKILIEGYNCTIN